MISEHYHHTNMSYSNIYCGDLINRMGMEKFIVSGSFSLKRVMGLENSQEEFKIQLENN